MNWQDISTAPKDGTWFLGWNGFWHVACWCVPIRAESAEGQFLAAGMRPIAPSMTHWAPLSAPQGG